MHKWEQKQRQKIHESIIENAKPTIKRTQNLGKSRQKNQLHSSRSRQLKTPLSTQNSFLPFVKILELFQLQKYSSLLIEHGFPHKLAEKKSMKFIDDILDHVDQVDQERFLSLMNTLTIMSKDLQQSNTSVRRITHFGNMRKDKSSKVTQYPPQPPSTGNLRKSHNYLTSSKKVQKTTLFKVRQTNNFKSPVSQNSQSYLTSKFSLSRPSKSIEKMKQTKPISFDKSTIRQQQIAARRNSKTPKKANIKKAFDDIQITHSFKNSQKAVPTKIVQNNKIIERLTEKLKKLNPQRYANQKQPTEDINLELQKIKKMYLSFDSATLTSNINNIDLEEIIDCFVEEIYVRVDRTHRKKANRPAKICNNRSYLKRNRPTPIKKYIELENKEEIEYLLKESLVIDQDESPLVEAFNPQTAINRFKKMQQRQREDTQEIIISSQSIVQQNHQAPPKEPLLHRQQPEDAKSISMKSSSSSNSLDQDLEVDFEIESFVEDFACFDNNLDQSLRPLERQDIKNFVQLVVMAGKMEKEMPIIAYMYLKKLLNTKKPYVTKPKLTLYNWKNIVLVTLIEASKIWDDTSLENHSFSKVLKPYTTYEINRLQKYFLFYIDYLLTIDQKQYCESYFELRKHSKEANKTAHLMSLDLKTIQVLQSIRPGIKKKQIQLKEYYRKKMDKSF